MQLTNGFVLQGGKYTIESVLGQGSFGITYLATTKFQGPLGDISVKVAIKEFFARDLNLRHPDGTVAEVSSGSLSGKYAKDFQREAKNLSSLKHPNIINVLEAFSENNTHYYVMEYLDGGNLDDYIQSKGRLNESEALDIASQMASALSYMHSHNMLHLDLKPRNVMRRSDGSVCLIDFGLSKQYESSGEPESSTTIGLGTPGYAPLEQGSSDERKNFAPTLDIYALGASIFKMLTGKTPPRASDIMNDGFPSEELEALGVRSETIQMIERLMSPRKKDRPQSVEECGLMAADRCIPKETASCTDDTELLKEEAGEETEVVEAPGSEKDVRATDHKKQEQNHWKWGLLVIAILTLLGFGGIRYYNHQKNLEYQRQILVEEARRQAVADSLKAVEEENARIAAEKAAEQRERLEREQQEIKRREQERKVNEYLEQQREQVVFNQEMMSVTNYTTPISEEELLKRFDYISDHGGGEGKVVYKNGKAGYVDKYGNGVIPCLYEDMWPHDGYFLDTEGDFPQYRVKLNNKWGIVNDKNQVVIPLMYDRIFNLKDGLAHASLNGKSGWIDRNNEVVVPFEYQLNDRYPSFNNYGYVTVKKNNMWGTINKNNQIQIPIIYDDFHMGDDYYTLWVKKGNKWGLITYSNDIILDFIYDSVRKYWTSGSNGAIFEVKNDGNIIHVDSRGRQIYR